MEKGIGFWAEISVVTCQHTLFDVLVVMGCDHGRQTIALCNFNVEFFWVEERIGGNGVE